VRAQPPQQEPAPPAAGERDAAVESLLEECLELEVTEQDAAVDRACARLPDLAVELRARFQWLRDKGLAGPRRARVEEGAQFAGYRLLRKLGGGGMGVVHLAEETALERRVALKTVRTEQLWFPGSRERFFREVRTIAKLQHAAIVPLYAVGEHEGVPYFTMEWVRGCTLAELLFELRGRDVESLSGRDAQDAVRRNARVEAGESPDTSPAPGVFAGGFTDFALRVTEAVADALAHAHAAGVLHRDVKPSNVMVAQDGRVLLLDFGLASAPESSGLTRTGSLLGSLPYMSPEQVRGEPLDARTDVYSLGATLYELLALRPAFTAADAATAWRRIVSGDAPPPRELHPGLPADVDAVCRVAMDVDRARRYPTAAALRDDLRRLLERQPIVARPPGPLLRARRFVQRHPTLTASAVLALLAAGGFPTGFLIRERSARREIEREAAAAEETVGLLEEVFLSASPARGGGTDVPMSARLEDAAIALEERLIERPELRGRLVGALGRVYGALGEDGRAIPLLEEAIALESAARGPNDSKVILLRMHHADALWRSARFADAESVLDALLHPERPAIPADFRVLALATRGALLEQIGRASASERDLAEAVDLATREQVTAATAARALRARGESLLNRDRSAEALRCFEEARDRLAVEDSPAKPARLLAELDVGRCLLALGRSEEALTLCARLVPQYEAVYSRDSIWLVEPLQTLAEATERSGDRVACERHLRRALAIAESRLAPGHPLGAWVRNELAARLDTWGRYGEAAEVLAPAVEIVRARPDAAPAAAALIFANAAGAVANLGGAARMEQARDFAEEARQRALSLQPPDPFTLGVALRASAWVELSQARLDEAGRFARDAAQVLEGSRRGRQDFGCALSILAIVENRGGRPRDGKARAERAVEALRAEPDGALLANAIYLVGWSELLLGERTAAGAKLRESIGMLERAHPEGHPLAAYPLNQLGELELDGNPREAKVLFEKALELRRRFLDPGDYWLGVSRNNLAAALALLGRDVEALKLWLENVEARRATGAMPDEPLAASLFQAARIHRRRGELDDAASLARECLEHQRRLLPAGHPSLVATKRMLGELLLELDETTEGEELLEEARAESGSGR
jgi:serine/threonine protein kinase/tetratricopeptide (TPR) repeat protein